MGAVCDFYSLVSKVKISTNQLLTGQGDGSLVTFMLDILSLFEVTREQSPCHKEILQNGMRRVYMEKLIQHTGGSAVLTIASAIFGIVASVVSIVSLFISINKNKAILKAQKIEYAVLIISIVFTVMLFSGVIGYCFCMYMML